MSVTKWKFVFVAGFVLILCVVLLIGCQAVPNKVTNKPQSVTSIHTPGTATFIINGCANMDEMLSIAQKIDAGVQSTGRPKSCWKSADDQPIPAVLIELIGGPYGTPFGSATVWQVLDGAGDVSFTMIPESAIDPAPMSAPQTESRQEYIHI